jgi:hypothetical protein
MKKWNEELWLLTKEEYKQLKNGTMLVSISGVEAVKGVDQIDQDTRYGCIAYGLTQEMVDKQGLEHEFLILMLKS